MAHLATSEITVSLRENHHPHLRIGKH